MTAWLNPATGLLIFPALSAVVLALLPGYRASAWVNVIGAFATLASATALLLWRPDNLGPLLQVDDLCIVFLVLNTLVGFTTAIFSRTYISHEIDNGKLKARHVRFYHALYQVLIGAMNLALLTSVTGLMWVAIEIATLTTVLIVAMYRTHEALEAAWKYFILGSIGIALALFGTILVYSAAQPVIGNGLPAMTFTMMQVHAAQLDPSILNLAFVFILLGYGTKAGLVPLHAWLPDAHAEGPTPISAVLSGLLLNVAIYGILRFKIIMAGNPATLAPGPLMMMLGLASVVFAALMLYRRRDIKRLFAYSSIEHMGIIAFAFGLGGPLANFAGLLHMAMHSLTKSGVFFTVGHITGVKHTQKITAITGLTTSHPRLGWIFVISVVAIAGLPPFGLFTSEFLVVSSAFARYPWMAVVLVLGLLIALGALFQRMNGIAFGEPSGSLDRDRISLIPIVIHLGIVLGAGIFLPGPLVAWFQHIAQLLG